MSELPLVSVVMPFYAQDDYVLDAVRSVERQTYPCVELVVVDDCSPGESAHDLIHWRCQDNVTIVRHQSNRGCAAARNTAIASARGELILPLDADDLLKAEYLERTVSLLIDDPDLAGVYTDVQVFGEREFVWEFDCSLPRHLTYGGPNTFLFWKKVFEATGGYKERLRFGEDFDFWISALEAGFKFARLAEPLYQYRKHAGGKTKRKDWPAVMQNLVAEHRATCEAYLEELLADQAEQSRHGLTELRDLCAKLDELKRLNSDYEAGGREGVGPAEARP